MNADISTFLAKQTCATICITDETGSPYCFSCFYAFDTEEKVLYFKSSPNSYHVKLFEKCKIVAGTVLPDKLRTLLVQGIQFTGIVLESTHPISEKASRKYHRRHPLALARAGEIWAAQLNSIKMTDSKKGFGTKTHWKREEAETSNDLSADNLSYNTDFAKV